MERKEGGGERYQRCGAPLVLSLLNPLFFFSPEIVFSKWALRFGKELVCVQGTSMQRIPVLYVNLV